MSQARNQITKQLLKYIEAAKDWDLYEITEWTFGYDDPLVEKFREEILKKEGKQDDGPRTNNEAKQMQS